MSIQTSDADLKAAQQQLVIIGDLTLYSEEPNPTFTAAVRFTNLTIVGLGDSGVPTSLGPFYINASTVSCEANANDPGNVEASFTGHITVLTYDDSGVTEGPCNFVTTMNGMVDSFSITLASGGINHSLTTNQTSALVVSALSLTNYSQIVIDARHVTSITVPASINFSSCSLTINVACPSLETNAILQALLDGGTSGSNITMGGTSGPPIVIPEIDELTIGGVTYPIDGYDTTLTGSGGATNLYNIGYDGSIPFSSSTGDAYSATIGIQDSPGTAAIASFLMANGAFGGRAVSVSGSVITISGTNRSEWPYGVSSSIDTLNNVSPGLDLVASLGALGNTVVTN